MKLPGFKQLMLAGLYVFFLTASYPGLMGTSVLDDAVLMLLVVLVAFRVWQTRTVSRQVIYVCCVLAFEFILSAFLSLIKSGYPWFPVFLTNLKLLFILLIPEFLQLTSVECGRVMRNFSIMSVPNILCGIYQFTCNYLLNIRLDGKYQPGWGFRLQGWTGHPIFFAMLLIIIVIYLLYFEKNPIYLLVVPMLVMMQVLTWTSFALILTVGLLAFWVIRRFPDYRFIQTFPQIIFAVVIVLAGAFLIQRMAAEPNTIRYVSAHTTVSRMNLFYFLFGSMMGSYASSGLSEAYFFGVFYDCGIIGLSAYIVAMAKLLRIQFRSHWFPGIYIAGAFLLNGLINEGYMLPLVCVIPVICSVRRSKLPEKNDSRDAAQQRDDGCTKGDVYVTD